MISLFLLLFKYKKYKKSLATPVIYFFVLNGAEPAYANSYLGCKPGGDSNTKYPDVSVNGLKTIPY